MRARSIEVAKRIAWGLTTLIAPHFPDVPAERLARTCDTLHRFVTGTLDQRLLFGTTSPTGMETDDAALAAELTVAALAYLQVSLGNPGPHA
jgi:hypothetical protein